jgi:Phosphoesterase family
VPAILVSPYARAGYVDSSQLDTASIPGLIDSVFKLTPLTTQVADGGSVLTGLDLHQQPIAPDIGPANGTEATLVRPAVGTIYVLYLGVLLAAILLLLLATFRQRRVSRSLVPAGGSSGPTGATGTSGRPAHRAPSGQSTGPVAEPTLAVDDSTTPDAPPANSPSAKILSGHRPNASSSSEPS